jgi:O-antigen/teichoic acid export membrane protein
MWTTAGSLAGRVVSMVGQLVLAYLLLPEDFGVLSLAMTVISLTNMLTEFGLIDVLNQRAKKLELWSRPAMAMSVTTGTLAMLVGWAIAPLWAVIYDNTDVGWMVMIMATASPVTSVGLLAHAVMRRDLRFKAISVVRTTMVIGNMTLTIILASLGFGPYSFAFSPVVAALFFTVSMTRMAGVGLPLRGGWRLGRWKYLLAKSSWGLLAGLFGRITQQGAYLVLGVLVTKVALGWYYMAYSLSVQAMMLATNNLGTVLMPALSHITGDPKRQRQAYLRTARVLAFVGAPLCLLQVAAAEPAIHLVLKPRWYPTIHIVQILSIGTMFMCISSGWSAAVRAQGRFRDVAIVNGIASALYLGSVMVSGWFAGVVGAAVGVTVYNAVIAPKYMHEAIKPLGGRWSEVAGVFARPIVVGAVSFAPAWAITRIPALHEMWIVQLVAVITIGPSLYLLLTRQFNRKVWNDFFEQVARVVRPKRG